ncbi:MAG: universal stress protein [Deltaproteobacteria bacterium]|nr:universal stress protein [Deltaproteobacteria bacterium]
MSIIVGTDISEAAGNALDVALALGKLRGDREVVLVHVAEDDDDAALAAARPKLDALAASRKGGLAIRTELVAGPVDQTLVQLAETESSDLIVVNARSRGKAPLGRNANLIISRSHVPVIVVRDPKPWLAYAAHERPLRLMLGIDDSAVCDLGIQWTHRMRSLGKVDVVLGAIYYPDDAAEHYGFDRKSMVDRDPEVEQVMERDLLRRYGTDLSYNVIARPRVGIGRIGDHMVELANEEKVDAILIGTGQKTGIGRLGSVSSVIVDAATQSVICVPPHATIPTMTVPVLRCALVATDLSQFSNRAVPYAFAACEPDAEIHIVHIIDDNAKVDVEDVRKQLLALPPVGAKQKVTAHVIRGDNAAKTVAQTAARLGVDIICICSHGRSGISRALVGSVADRLLRATRLPVLVLRPA